MNKPRIIKDYDKLTSEVVEQIKLVYPRGFKRHLISFYNKEGERKMGLPFETEEYYYLVRMTAARAADIIEQDDDFDADGILKAKAKARYEDKYEDVDFLDEFNSNTDNDLGVDEVEDLDEIPDPSTETDTEFED